MSDEDADLFKTSDGEVALWLDPGSSLHLRAITKSGDPVELSLNEAKSLADALTALIDKAIKQDEDWELYWGRDPKP